MLKRAINIFGVNFEKGRFKLVDDYCLTETFNRYELQKLGEELIKLSKEPNPETVL